MATISLQCNSLSEMHSSVCYNMTGRGYMGEVLIQVWLKSIELLENKVNL